MKPFINSIVVDIESSTNAIVALVAVGLNEEKEVSDWILQKNDMIFDVTNGVFVREIEEGCMNPDPMVIVNKYKESFPDSPVEAEAVKGLLDIKN